MVPDESDTEFSIFGEGETIEEPGQKFRDFSENDLPAKRYTHEEWLYQQYAILGKTLQEIADHCEVREKTIWRWVQKHDIDARSGGSRPGPWSDEDWLRSQYVGQQKTVCQIADEQDCDEKTIRNWLTEHGIDTRDHSERHPASREDRPYRDKAWLREQYVDAEKAAAEIAADCDVSESTIHAWLGTHGIETRSVEDARQISEARSVRPPDAGTEDDDGDGADDIIERGSDSIQYQGPESGIDVSYRTDLKDAGSETVESPYRNEEWLREQYERAGTASAIAEICAVDPGTVYYWMDRFGIERSRGNTDARYRDEDWLREAYDDFGTLEAVADECDVSPGTIRNWMIRFDIERGPDALGKGADN